MASKFLIDIDLNGNEIQNFGIQTTGTLPASPFNGQVVNHNGQMKHYVTGTGWKLIGLTADGTTITDASGTISVGTIAVSNVSGLQTALDGKVDDAQVLTNVPAGAVFTDTTYSAGNGVSLSGTTFSVAGGDGLTQEASGLKVDSTVVRTSGAQTIAGNKTFSNDIVINGDLTVSGAVTTKLSETVNIEDNIVVLNSNETGSPTENAGIEVERGTALNTLVRWNEGALRWEFTNDGSTYNNIPESGEYTNNVGDITGVTAGTGLSGGATSGNATINLSHLGLESLADPNADRIAFWDDSASAFAWLSAGTNVTISGTTISSTDTNTTYSEGTGLDLTGTTFSLAHLGLEDLVDPNGDRIAFWDDSAGKFDWLTAGSNVTISGTTISATNTNTTYSAGNGISLSGTTFSVAAGTGLTQDASGLSVTANGIGATQLDVVGNGTAGQVLTSDADGSFSWTDKTVNTNTQRTDEEIEDVVGAMVTGNSEAGITVAYQDGDGTLDFTNSYIITRESVSGHTAGTYVVDCGALGVNVGEYPVVQVYDSAREQVATTITLDTINNEIDVYLPTGDWTISISGTRL